MKSVYDHKAAILDVHRQNEDTFKQYELEKRQRKSNNELPSLIKKKPQPPPKAPPPIEREQINDEENEYSDPENDRERNTLYNDMAAQQKQAEAIMGADYFRPSGVWSQDD